MSDNKREQERAELYKSIWGIANDLRGSVDGWDSKNYVLTTLFYRYISENLTAYINKSGGEYFTPQEVSRLLTMIGLSGRTKNNKVYENCTTSLIRVAAA